MNKIIVNMAGRTGNQLFRYAFARIIQINNGGKLILNFQEQDSKSIEFPHQDWEAHLQEFQVYEYERVSEHIKDLSKVYFTFGQKFSMVIFRCLRKLFPNKMNNRNISSNKMLRIFFTFSGIFIFPFVDYKNLENSICQHKNVYLDMPCENYQLFKPYRSILYKELIHHTNKKVKKSEFYQLIKSTNSICVTIRRGDYLSEQFKKDFFVTDEAYFSNGISLMKEKVFSPVFFFFSDDLDYIKEFTTKYLLADDQYFVEEQVYSVSEKLMLMSSCKHFLISNSTFSWWAQFLGNYSKKIVIGPKYWHPINSKNKNEGLVQGDWIKI